MTDAPKQIWLLECMHAPEDDDQKIIWSPDPDGAKIHGRSVVGHYRLARPEHQTQGTAECWYVKDFADGWIKFYDPQMALNEARESGAIMLFSPDGSYPR